MATVYEQVVIEDLALGTGTVAITNPAGGSLIGTKIPPSMVLWKTNTVQFVTTPNFDLSLGNFQEITLTASVTSSTLSNLAGPQLILFKIIQDATGGWTFAWPSNILGGGNVNTGAAKINIQLFYFDGTNGYPISPLMAY